ncbi:ATP-binding protein [Streptomyces sp. NBC_01334]|uniref:ATP-binding protein n=1 Tax=Streptomyces sp. NBC_01334 TaxID=2903827 RepID=UPI002E15D43C|nr:ATP-binding protein [Streptomyces sp. NBC_01334]
MYALNETAAGSSSVMPPVAICAMPTLPASVPAMRHLAVKVASRWQLGDIAESLELVVTELVTNAVKHSGASEVVMLLAHESETSLKVQVKDSGQWLVSASDTSSASLPVDGWGLSLVSELCAHCEIRAGEHGTTVTATLVRTEPAPEIGRSQPECCDLNEAARSLVHQ